MDINNIEQHAEPSGARVEVPGVTVEVTKDDTWETMGMIAALVLVIYVGIKLINKYIK